MLALTPCTEMEFRVADVTVNWDELLTPLNDAVIVVVPAATPVTRPAELIVATAVLEEVQLTWLVKLCVVPLLYCPVALN